MTSSKKKITQDELRRLMNEQKRKLLNNVKKIDSPLARYDKDGVLHCTICETVVRSEAVWKVHISSKNHKQNVSKKKEVSLKPNDSVAPIKFRKPEPPLAFPPSKKIKGILKNSLVSKVVENSIQQSNVPTKSKLLCIGDDDDDDDDDHDHDDDDDDDDDDKKNVNSDNQNENKQNKTCLGRENVNIENENSNQEILPEGFFDDPKLDAKVRNVEYKDPIEEEWEQFQREIKEETTKAQQIIAEDQEEATAERQISEIDEQIRNWSRVVNLEKQKEKVSTLLVGQKINSLEDDNPDEEEEFEEFLNWRSKKSFDYKLNK